MAILANEALIHIQEHLGLCHYKSIFTLTSFLENAFESEGYEEIKSCPICQNFYAISLQYGSGVPKDVEKAMKLLMMAAEQGYAKAQFNLARDYEKGIGVEVDIEKAYELCKAAADQNYQDALHALPRMAKKYKTSQEIDKAERFLRDSNDDS